jgi:DnaJ-class molecular chaperone
MDQKISVSIVSPTSGDKELTFTLSPFSSSGSYLSHLGAGIKKAQSEVNSVLTVNVESDKSSSAKEESADLEEELDEDSEEDDAAAPVEKKVKSN